MYDPIDAPAGREFPMPKPEETAGDGTPPGLAEAPAFFQPAPIIQTEKAKTPYIPGVRLSRVGTPDLAIPDIAALPRGLRDHMVKRVLDISMAGALLLVFAVPMAVIALALRAEGGSALFLQRRVGRNRSRFTCLKFRTMHANAEARLQEVLASEPAAMLQWLRYQKLTPDPRATRLGHLLRVTSLDELPQLINVLRGEMSLVGPRPVIAPEVDGYPADRAYFASPDFEDYAGCLPGITGLWQVCGRHGTTHAERVRLDRIYARNWSVVLDLKILWRTVMVVLSRTGR